jgi:hypothetical protein
MEFKQVIIIIIKIKRQPLFRCAKSAWQDIEIERPDFSFKNRKILVAYVKSNVISRKFSLAIEKFLLSLEYTSIAPKRSQKSRDDFSRSLHTRVM